MWVIMPKALGMTYAATFTKNLLRVIILIQYIPRMSRFTPLLAGHSPTGFIFETAQANFFINLFLFLLVAHVVGSCWYLFGLQVCYKYFPFLNFVNNVLGLRHLQSTNIAILIFFMDFSILEQPRGWKFFEGIFFSISKFIVLSSLISRFCCTQY